MAFKGDQGDELMAEINVVPLVDIILVVLIIFMVTAPMIMKPSINVNLPKSGSGDPTKPSKLNILIASDGRVLLDGKTATDEEISAVAKAEFEKNPEVQAVISADREVQHGKVVSIMDLIKASGVKKFAISIDKK
jgi:biopolymer transport protein ExbD